MDPEDPEAYRMLGYILLEEQRYDEALEYFQKSVEINDSYSLTWLNWSLALMLQDEDEEAKTKLKKGFELLYHKNEYNKKEEVLQVLNKDLAFKQRYLESANDVQRITRFKANIEGLKKIISFLEKYDSHLEKSDFEAR